MEKTINYQCKVELNIDPSSDIEKLEESLSRHIAKWIDEQTEEVAEEHRVGNFYQTVFLPRYDEE
jgi:TorA maturation chaperone TorD